MRRRLTLIRHAKSIWDALNLRDFDRPLNRRGERDAPEMGQRLKQIDFLPEQLISSPAQRARQTAEIIAAQIGLREERILFDEGLYLASLEDLLNIIRNLDDRLLQVALCGHTPGLTELAAWLTGRGPDNLPTAAIFGVSLDLKSWDDLEIDMAEQTLYDFPKNR